jgi:transcriptional regulator with XRE-family HTH domain
MDRDVARHLIEERARLGLTQGEFAARIGVSQGAVSRWEKGRHRPNPEVLMRLGRLSGAAPEGLKLSRAVDGASLPVDRLGVGRSRLRFRPIEEPRRRLSDLLEASIAGALRIGKDELAGALRPILERCREADRRHPSGRRADDRASH